MKVSKVFAIVQWHLCTHIFQVHNIACLLKEGAGVAKHPDQLWGPFSLHFNGYQGSFLGVK